MADTIVPTPKNATRHWSEGWAELTALQQAVESKGTAVLRGNTLNHDFMVPLLQKAVRAGTISPHSI